jgi:glycosyltransferase involved in cell wall biosynthesis
MCIVIPAYNEQATLKPNIQTIMEYVSKLPPVVTVLVVDDGSRDSTPYILEDLLKQYENKGLRVITNPQNKGYGAALRTGIGFAVDKSYDYVLFMDSDLTNHPRYIESFYEKMAQGWDYIKATRYSKGGGVKGVPWVRRLFSIVGNFVARVLYGLPLTDLTNGFRAAKVDILKRMTLTESGFPIIMEELFQAKYLTKSFCEVPYVLTSRTGEQGRTRFSYDLPTWLRYLKYAMRSFLKRN